MRLLVLGGTRFVGRAIIEEALARGWDVTAVHRGISGALPVGSTPIVVDRTHPGELAEALSAGSWDAVVDTWDGPPAVVSTSARLLAGRVDTYAYISSGSVYTWGQHVKEDSPVIDGDPAGLTGDYAALKRGAELAVLQQFPDAVLCRAGLILGPHEDIGRLPWWLQRISRGGRVVAPGRPERPLQLVDARDLATWVLSAVVNGVSGPVDVISPPGHTTTKGLLDACVDATASDAELVWVPEAQLAAAGAEPWSHLPCWVPEEGEFAGFLEVDTTRAAHTGLTCRPISETVRDTWSWLQREGPPPQRPDRDVHGLPADLERQLLS